MAKITIEKNGSAHHHHDAKFTHAKDKLTDGAEAAYEGVIEMLEKAGYEVKKHSCEARDSVQEYVKANPFKAIGYSVLAGVILTLIAKK